MYDYPWISGDGVEEREEDAGEDHRTKKGLGEAEGIGLVVDERKER